MSLRDWEGTVLEIIAECGHEQRRVDNIFMAWRSKLQKEPTLLNPQQIDEIIREVRQRLKTPNR